jgi:hypothetical protein
MIKLYCVEYYNRNLLQWQRYISDLLVEATCIEREMELRGWECHCWEL